MLGALVQGYNREIPDKIVVLDFAAVAFIASSRKKKGAGRGTQRWLTLDFFTPSVKYTPARRRRHHVATVPPPKDAARANCLSSD